MVHVRTASPRRFYRVPTMHVLSKNKKNIKIFPYIAMACFHNDILSLSLSSISSGCQYQHRFQNLTAMSGVGSSPALATCETSQVLLAGVSGGFS